MADNDHIKLTSLGNDYLINPEADWSDLLDSASCALNCVAELLRAKASGLEGNGETTISELFGILYLAEIAESSLNEAISKALKERRREVA